MDAKTNSILQQLAIPLILSLATWVGWFVFTTLDDKRKNELEFVRGQIVDLYGPMYTLSAADESVWKSLDKGHSPKFAAGAPTDDEIRIWRALMKQVVQPLNQQMETTFLSSKQLIRCPATRDALHELVAFAKSVKLLTSSWPENDVSDKTEKGNKPELPYPPQLSSLLLTELNALHDREQKLDNGFYGLFLSREDRPCRDGATAQTP